MKPIEFSVEELVKLADRKRDLHDISKLITILCLNKDEHVLQCVALMTMLDFRGSTYKAEFHCLYGLKVLHWGPAGQKPDSAKNWLQIF